MKNTFDPIKCSIPTDKCLFDGFGGIYKCDVCGKRICDNCYRANKSFHHVGKPTKVAAARHCSKACADITTNKSNN